ncbi:MAG: hypothetical protein Q7K39_03945 [Candidatus Magasanikbacteria bacterium]|nr:hypothetical protein [Candidatus Magasanikbacteria bacterium]
MAFREFSLPSFLDTHSAPDNLNGKEGSFVVPRSLKSLPPNITERVEALAAAGKEYVIKQYIDEKFDNGKFTFDYLFTQNDIDFFIQDEPRSGVYPLSTKNAVDFTAVDRYVILKRRQDELKRYLGKSLAGTVVESEFFIANNQKNEPTIYEIQEKLPPFITLEDIEDWNAGPGTVEHHLESLAEDVKNKLKIKISLLIEKLTELLNKKNDDPFFKFFYPDVGEINFALTQVGDIKLFDTNYCEPKNLSSKSMLPKINGSILKLHMLLEFI